MKVFRVKTSTHPGGMITNYYDMAQQTIEKAISKAKEIKNSDETIVAVDLLSSDLN